MTAIILQMNKENQWTNGKKQNLFLVCLILTVASALDLVYFRSPFEARRFEYVEVDGKQNKGLWFRFKEPGEETSQVDESLTPLSAKAKEYLLRAWRAST